MNIFVLLKQTFDTEERIVLRDGAISEDGVKFVINPYDEFAVEQAIQLRDEFGGKVTVVSVGPDRASEALRTALAMGADEAVLIRGERIPADEAAVSRVLAAYLRQQSFDLILGGHFSIDQGACQVAVRLAKLLDLPHTSAITGMKLEDGRAIVTRDAEGDQEIVEVALPALFTAQQGLNEPRYPSLQGIMKAKKKPLATLSLDDLGLTAEALEAGTSRISVSLPPERAEVRMMKGELRDQAAELVQLLRHEAKVI